MTSLTKATKIFTFFSILFFASSIQAQISDSIYTIPKGTKIRVRMDNEINSRVSSVNDTFTVITSEPVRIRGVEMLPVNTVIEGRILRSRKASIGNKNGILEVSFETLFLPDGEKRSIEGSLIALENRKSFPKFQTAAIVGATGIGALVGAVIEKTKGALIGAGVGLGIGTGTLLLRKGKEAGIKADEEFFIVLQKNLNLPPQEF